MKEVFNFLQNGIDYMFTITSIILIFFISIAFTYKTKDKIDELAMIRENKEVLEAKKDIRISFEVDKNRKNKDILSMMYDNVSELKEYYVISKQQARKSFSAALLACIFGFFFYLFGILSTIFFKTNTSIISAIGGTVAEVISALFFWLYRESTKQLSVYHQRLGSTEKYLTAIQIIKDLPEDKQYEQYSNLIEHILRDNQEIIKQDNSKEK